MASQQIFIQALMHNGIVSESMMKQLCKNIFENSNENILDYIGRANNDLEGLGMGIKSATCELTGEKYWVFISTVIPERENLNYDNKLILEFSQVELKYLNKIFEEILNSDEGYISSINCINMVEEMDEKFTRTQADEFIKKMIRGMWLSLKDGQIYLGVRSIVEFIPLFKAKFKDNLTNCFLCKLTVFHGQICESCGIKVHTYCQAKVLKMNSKAKCLNCKNSTRNSLNNESSEDATIASDPRIDSNSRITRSRKINH